MLHAGWGLELHCLIKKVNANVEVGEIVTQ